MSVGRGNLLYIYEKCLLDGIGSFVSARLYKWKYYYKI